MALNLNFAKNKSWNCPAAPAFTSIGTVGSAGQMAAGHVLEQASFPSAAYAATSFYNLTNTSTVNDGNTVLGHNLTNTPSTPFTGTGILGIANSCASFNGTTHYLSSNDPHFHPGNVDFTFGGWIKQNSWGTGNQDVFTQWYTPYASFIMGISSGNLYINISTDGSSAAGACTYNVSSFTGWHHVSCKHVASTKTVYLYVDGKLVAQFTYTGTIYSTLGNQRFNIGSRANGTSYPFAGLIDEFFFCNGTAFTDNDIAKIYARKYSHNLNIAPVSQKWVFQAQNGGQTRELFDNIVDMQANDLYYDLSDESSTTQVSLRLANIY